MAKCRIVGCPEQSERIRLCPRHYALALESGGIQEPRRAIEKLLERMETVQPTKRGCLEWPGASTGRFEYGQIRGDGPRPTIVLAHRVAWEAFHDQEIPQGLVVLHDCDTPRCVNPLHLRVGTQADNVADMHAKRRNRQPRGEASGLSKLTAADVKEIRRLAGLGFTQRAIAKQFGVTHPNVGSILRRETWAHVD